MATRIAIHDICEVYDGPHATPKKTLEGPIYLGIDAITDDGKLDADQFSHLSEGDYIKWTKRVTPRYGDIVFSYEATLGRYALIPEDFYGCLGRRLAVIRNTSPDFNTKWLYYYFRSAEWTNFIQSKIIKGSTVNRISVEDFPTYTIPCVPLRTQNKIVDVLSRIDRKIQINDAINDNLEYQAKLLYDYWFLQFEFPGENGKPYKSSGGAMVWNKQLKCKVPVGWQVTALKGLFNIERGVSYTSKEIENVDGTPMINLASVDTNRNYKPTELKYYSGKVDENSYLKANDLLIACTDLTRNADIVGCPILVPDDRRNYIYSMDMAKISSATDKLDEMYLYMTLRTKFYHNFIKRWASGTNVLHLNLEGLNWYTTWLPPISLQKKYSKIVKRIHKQKCLLNTENENLISLRNWLLPMLMNGQATVED